MRGTLSVALAHTQACYKRSVTTFTSGLSPFSKRNKGKPLAAAAQSVSGTSKIFKSTPSPTVI